MMASFSARIEQMKQIALLTAIRANFNVRILRSAYSWHGNVMVRSTVLMDLTKQTAPKHVHKMDSSAIMDTASMNNGAAMAKTIVRTDLMKLTAFQ